MYKLCPIFGLVPSSVSVWLDFGLEVMQKIVRTYRDNHFRICWPSEHEMRNSASLLTRNRPYGRLLSGVFAVMDGGRMPCASYSDPDVQNAFWEGYTQAHEVTNLFVWNFYGELIFAAVNFPGSWHDSRVAAESGLYAPTLTEDTPTGFCVLADSAFPRTSAILEGKIVRGRKANELGESSGVPKNIWLAAVETLLDRAMPSERQSAEWGVRAIKGPFKRLTTTLPSDALSRGRIILLCCHLYNLRVRKVGLNQIRTVYANVEDDVQPWVRELSKI